MMGTEQKSYLFKLNSFLVVSIYSTDSFNS